MDLFGCFTPNRVPPYNIHQNNKIVVLNARNGKAPMKPTFSIIAPIFNETESIPELYRRVSEVMDGLGEPWELVLIDDGSQDGSTQMLCDLAKKDNRVRPIIFARN